jgi:hypothetical protein
MGSSASSVLPPARSRETRLKSDCLEVDQDFLRGWPKRACATQGVESQINMHLSTRQRIMAPNFRLAVEISPPIGSEIFKRGDRRTKLNRVQLLRNQSQEDRSHTPFFGVARNQNLAIWAVGDFLTIDRRLHQKRVRSFPKNRRLDTFRTLFKLSSAESAPFRRGHVHSRVESRASHETRRSRM